MKKARSKIRENCSIYRKTNQTSALGAVIAESLPGPGLMRQAKRGRYAANGALGART